MSRTWLRWPWVVAIAVLSACAVQPTRPPRATDEALAAQAARERELATRAHWSLEGRLGISDGHDSGSGSLQWTQTGEAYRFVVHAPVTGKTWVLTGDAHHARIEGLQGGAVEGEDAATLLRREVGWQVPFAQLVDWARAARAPGAAQIRFDAQGLPEQIEQDGWLVRYADYDHRVSPPLPRRVFASRGELRVRLAIRDWQS